MQKIVLLLIRFYQKYLTILSYGSCRYHPTCSSYAKIQFENNNFFKAVYYSTLRILRCNPLFGGGFDYPVTKCKRDDKINLEFKKIKVKYWKIPQQNNQCLIVEQKKWK
ncbi:MAG: membrane protein insertion efficiency factor YidD [Campylobacterota bacterium]|nr:membrane protein insertion efficiency factor YidD [Campylobacterota bacterium]